MYSISGSKPLASKPAKWLRMKLRTGPRSKRSLPRLWLSFRTRRSHVDHGDARTKDRRPKRELLPLGQPAARGRRRLSPPGFRHHKSPPNARPGGTRVPANLRPLRARSDRMRRREFGSPGIVAPPATSSRLDPFFPKLTWRNGSRS